MYIAGDHRDMQKGRNQNKRTTQIRLHTKSLFKTPVWKMNKKHENYKKSRENDLPCLHTLSGNEESFRISNAGNYVVIPETADNYVLLAALPNY